MGASVGVLVDERVDQGLERFDRVGLGCLGGEPFLHRLVEPFDFAAGGRVVGSGVFLVDLE